MLRIPYFVLFSVVFVIVITTSNIECSRINFNAALSIRGGAKSAKSKYCETTKSKPTKSKIRKSESNENGKSKKSSKNKSDSRKLDLVVSKRKNQKKGGGLKLPNLNLKENLDTITKTSLFKDVYRRAKVLRSSPFEAMLLKATWPTNEPIAPELLNEIIKHSIPAFKYGSLSNTEDDPYHMTLHKLWSKMTEKDWRVVLKSTFILHCISRDSSYDTCERFMDAMTSMSKLRNPKRPDHKYFSHRIIKDLDSISQPYEPFVSAYANYVFYRSKNFIGRYVTAKYIINNHDI